MPFSVYFSFASKNSHNNHKENIFSRKENKQTKTKTCRCRTDEVSVFENWCTVKTLFEKAEILF